MKISERILQGIKTALTEGEATVKVFESAKEVNEASALTGSGSGIGGRTYFDNAFAVARYMNPFRMGSRQVLVNGSDAQFVAKTGNAADSTNPWTYAVNPNSGSPNIDTTIWQLPVRVITAQLPIRTAVLSDVNNLDESLVSDLFAEFSQLEAQSMATNNDQSGTTTTSTGGTNGLRGLTSYLTNTAAAFGTSGTAITNGIHTIKAVTHSVTVPDYDMMVNLANALPAQYWAMPTTAWHIHPDLIASVRKLKNTAGLPLFIEVGDDDGAALGYVFGFPVIPNPYLDAPTGAGKIPLILANWDSFLTIGDTEEMNIKRFDQTQPGFVVLFAEKRIVSTIRDPFAGVYLKGV
ncbi:major_cap_HK97, phage major capsid protein, HK97 family [uncultured Caudovirales phage]|uniref:Major_cap_HK97, phage major capsid protein, HK97 family n=1 Tax=uncultured Caudovirales phage TaxID=2100421 RepID=A0A6J5LIA0_9CAUD|nr:major_cap_HK97, phage major capsid protein, HK97 family [uncultured Caudovirales phage]CAB4241991.1 major_cap_HK97, phage major capsid protein, HK97 family [uncultured Caudovirales phage]